MHSLGKIKVTIAFVVVTDYNIWVFFLFFVLNPVFFHYLITACYHIRMGFLGGLDGKESGCNAGDLCLIPELGLSTGGGFGHPLQYSCLENFMDRAA